MPRFEFATAGRIIFGSGALADIGPIVAGMGRRALVVSGGSSLRVEALLAYLTTAGVKPIPFAVVGEPTPDTVRTGVQRARQLRCDVVIGCGGGSVLDTGKAVAALLTNGGDPLDYLAGSGPGQSLTQAAAPCIAIPTTAGSGAEVTPQAVLHLPEERRKVSLRSPLLLPRVALIDPELTHSLPPALTASTGLAALTQLIEPYVSPHATPPTDALALDGLHRAARSLRRACQDGGDFTAREDMALASLYGGLALANAGAGAVYGLAGLLGGMFEAPHGALCAALLPAVMAVKVRALETRAPDSEAMLRYDEIAQILTGEPDAVAAEGVAWVRQLVRDLSIPPLRACGLTEADFPAAVELVRAGELKGNPIRLTEVELMEILAQAG